MTITAEAALAALTELVIPEGAKVRELQTRVAELEEMVRDLRDQLRQEKDVVEAVQEYLAGRDPSPYSSQHGHALARRVKEKCEEPQKRLQQATCQKDREAQRLAYARRDHETAKMDLRHHTVSLVQLYNKSAGNILFGLGEQPDFMALYDAIDQAINKLAKEKANA